MTYNGTDLACNGNITAYASSDIKFKENIQDINNALSVVNFVGGKTFDWTDEWINSQGGPNEYLRRKNDFGIVAQDLESVFPLGVRVREDGTLAVDYQKLAALAFAAIKELTARVERLEGNK